MPENTTCIGWTSAGGPPPEEAPRRASVHVRLGTATSMISPSNRTATALDPNRAFDTGRRGGTSLQSDPERRRSDRKATPRIRWDSVSDRNVRRLNVAVAAIGLVLAIPLMILIGLAVKLTSRGPIFYRQERVGHDRRRNRGADRRSGARNGNPDGRRQGDQGGRIFTMYKFRTMDVRPATRQTWARPDDPRITPVGRILRKYRLDEIPQLYNVLRGDMNIVGPRPEQPQIFQELRAQVERYAERQTVLPGITGWAQVNHHYDQCLDDVRRKVGLDLEYIQRRSATEDLKIMARTLPVMVRRKGSV